MNPEDTELVTSEARNDVRFAENRLQNLRKQAQQLIACFVTVPVVDLLQAVSIDEQDKNVRAQTLGCLQLLFGE